MIKLKRDVRPYLDCLDALGVEIVDLTMTGSCHYKITVTSHGNQRFFITPSSPSDQRGIKNFRSEVRRWVKTCNSQHA